MLRLSRLISDGCIFQRNKEIRITGWTDGETIEVQLLAKENLLALAITKVAGGSFTAILPAMEVGGPYELQVSSGKVDDAINISDIYIGDVFQLVGQSNIEFPMSRVRESYPEEFENPDIPLIRTFKVVEHREFHGPLAELETGEWKAVTAETLPDFSAVGYFMAKKLYEETGVPIGLIDTTLGGSTIESWMSAEMLSAFPEQQKIAETYRDDAYLEKVLQENEENADPGRSIKCRKKSILRSGPFWRLRSWRCF